MDNKTARWQDRFNLTTCPAGAIDPAIPATALGVAVIYEKTKAGEKIFLVVESRTSGLRDQCLKRLHTPKLPPVESLTVSYKAEILPDASPEAVQTACRQQVILAGELRRELRPAMR